MRTRVNERIHGSNFLGNKASNETILYCVCYSSLSRSLFIRQSNMVETFIVAQPVTGEISKFTSSPSFEISLVPFYEVDFFGRSQSSRTPFTEPIDDDAIDERK